TEPGYYWPWARLGPVLVCGRRSERGAHAPDWRRHSPGYLRPLHGRQVASAGLGGLLAAQLGTTAAAVVEPAVLAEAVRATFLAAVTIVMLGMLLRDAPRS